MDDKVRIVVGAAQGGGGLKRKLTEETQPPTKKSSDECWGSCVQTFLNFLRQILHARLSRLCVCERRAAVSGCGGALRAKKMRFSFESEPRWK